MGLIGRNLMTPWKKEFRNSTNIDKSSMMWLQGIIMNLNKGTKLKNRQLEFQTTSYAR